MSPQELKEAVFYIVEVGEDQRGVETKRKKERQEREHKKMMEWIDDRIKRCEEVTMEKMAELHKNIDEQVKDNTKFLR